MDALKAKSGIAACDAYLANGYNAVVGMSSQFAAGVTCGLLRIQSAAGVTGPVVEVGGVGLLVRVSSTTGASLPPWGPRRRCRPVPGRVNPPRRSRWRRRSRP